MRTESVMRAMGPRGATAVLCAVLAFQGCVGLDDVDIPELDGPSTFAQNLFLTATPDLLVADGVSQSVITAQFLDVNGRPSANQEIFFTIADEGGRFAAIGSFPSDQGPAFAISGRTDGNGVVRVVYQAPPRTDATADQTILVAARPIGTDAATALYRTVRIELRSAEPRQFPQNPDNDPPICNFVIEIPRGSCGPVPTPVPLPSGAPAPSPSPSPVTACSARINTPVLVQTSSFDADGTIVRYLWSFGNGRAADTPDSITSYSQPGTYTIQHQVTDDDGVSALCRAEITIVP
jgi:PKD domain-containing protein